MRLEIPQHKLTLSGNTAGALQILSSGVVTIAGGNNITVSQAGNAITISGPNAGGAQTAISGIVASDATYTSGTVEFVGAGIITISSGPGQQVVIDASQSVQPETQTFIAGIGNSETTYTSGTVRLSELGAVTIRSTTGNQFQISVNSQSVQPETQTFLGGLAASDKTYTSGTVVLTGAGGGVTVQSNAGQTITLSVAAPVAQTNQTEGWYALGNTTGQSTSTTLDARTISIRGDGIVSVGYSAGSLRISATEVAQTNQSLGMYAVQNTTGQSSSTTMDARTISVAGDGAVSVGYSAGSLRISAPTQTVQTQGILSAGVSTGGNTQGNTQVSTGSRLVLVGSGMISASQGTAAGASTITLNATQSVQSLGMYAVQNTTGQSSSTTMDARTLSVAGDGAVSVGYSAGSLRISAPVQTVESQSIGASNVGNTLGTSGVASGGQVRVVINGTSNITVSQSVNGASATLSLIGQPAMSAGISNVGNTSGDTGITGTRLVLAGGNNITLSQSTNASGGTVTISAPNLGAGAMSAGASNLGNTAGSTGITGTQLVLVGSGVMSLSQSTGANGGTLSILAPATSSLVGTSGVSISTNGSTISVMQTSGGPGYLESWFPASVAPHTSGNQGQGTLHMQPMPLPTDVRMDRILLPTIVSNATNSSNSISISQYVGIYTRNASTLSLLTSQSTSTNFSGSGTVGSYSLYGGRRWQSMALTTTLSSGDYWMAIIIRTTTGGGAGHTVNQELVTQFSNATFSGWSGLLGAATNASMQYQKGLGTFTATTAGLPSAVPFASLTGTGTLVMCPPIYALMSGTV